MKYEDKMLKPGQELKKKKKRKIIKYIIKRLKKWQ